MKKLLYILLFVPLFAFSQGLISDLVKLEGLGNGGNELEFTSETRTEIINNFCSNQISYLLDKGPIQINVINEDYLPVGQEFIFKYTPNIFPNWMLVNSALQDTVFAENAVSSGIEQVISEWGLSVNIMNGINPGDDTNGSNGLLSATLINENPTSWLGFVPDNDLFGVNDDGAVFAHPANWIRSGTATIPDPSNSSNTIFIDMGSPDEWEDENSTYESVLGGMWAPYRLVGYDKDDIAFTHSPSNGPSKQLDQLTSVDIVYTDDKSLWTRVPVIETGDTITRMLLKNMPSVDKYGIDETDGSTGFSWFPGYALDLERGTRLNMMFGEASTLPSHNGNDMIWNPTSTVIEGDDFFDVNNVVFGGRHYVYVAYSRYAGDQEQDHPLYNRLTNMSSFVNQVKVSQDIAWVSIPLLSSIDAVVSDGDIEVKIRVSKSYETYISECEDEVSSENLGNLNLHFFSHACFYEEFTEFVPNWPYYNNSACETIVVEGCIDSLAVNYDITANTNDGSCYPVIEGCIDEAAFNYISLVEDVQVDVNTDDDSCYPVIDGCIDTSAFNYISLVEDVQVDANTDDGSCYPIIDGCMDTSAFNYIALTGEFLLDVNTDDGSCISVVIDCMLDWADNYNISANTPINDICYREGCMNYTAENYDSLATEEDNTCLIDGCNLSFFPNYNPIATDDLNSSCDPSSTDVWGCINPADCSGNYNPNVNMDNGSCEYPNEGLFCNGDSIPYIGMQAFGGIVFYVDQAGENGLVAAMDDLSGTYQWGCNNIEVSGAQGVAIGTGYQNTIDIVNDGCVALDGGVTSAQACLDYEISIYNDWYLPSIDELNEMYITIAQGDNENIGGFISGAFVSSTEVDATGVEGTNFFPQNVQGAGDYGWSFKIGYYHIRPIRTFYFNENYGCTDSSAFNFDAEVDTDNGTCIPFIYDCTDELSCNYNSGANTDDGSCVNFEGCESCSGEIDGTGVIIQNDIDFDGVCDTDEILGCQDESSLNYNIDATDEDESCIYSLVYLDSIQNDLNIVNTNFNNLESESISSLSSLQQALDSWNTTIDLITGWNMFGYGCPTSIDLAEGLSNHTESVVIVKDNNGSVYMPEFSFNGIGDLTPGFGYQIKVTEAIDGFSLCDWYVNDIPEDNIVSLQEEVEELSNQLDSLSSIIEIGDVRDGGIVFYIDDSGKHGLIAAINDIGNYQWGCYGAEVNGADGFILGAGLQNSLEITASCTETPNAASVCLNYENQGYTDWYLPSKVELEILVSILGEYTCFNYLTEMLNVYWSSTEWEGDPSNGAWHISGTSNTPGNYAKSNLRGVRPIRSF